MRTRTLAQLREDVRQRADFPAFGSETFVTTDTVNRWINQSVRRFVGLLVRSYGASYYAASSSFATAPGVDSYALPSDMYQLLAVRMDAPGHGRREVPRASMGDIDRTQDPRGLMPEAVPAYRLLGNRIHITPTPDTARAFTIHYVPTLVVFDSLSAPAVDLASDTHFIDGVNGWEEWIVLDAAMKCLQKEESDISALLREQKDIEQEIVADAQMRDQGAPQRVRNTYVDDWGMS